MPLPSQEPCFDEIDLNANPEFHKMMNVHATPTVLLYCSGQLVDEFTCAGDSGPRVMLMHLEEQVGSIPGLWHRKRSGPSPESLTAGTTSCVPATGDDAWLQLETQPGRNERLRYGGQRLITIVNLGNRIEPCTRRMRGSRWRVLPSAENTEGAISYKEISSVKGKKPLKRPPGERGRYRVLPPPNARLDYEWKSERRTDLCGSSGGLLFLRRGTDFLNGIPGRSFCRKCRENGGNWQGKGNNTVP